MDVTNGEIRDILIYCTQIVRTVNEKTSKDEPVDIIITDHVLPRREMGYIVKQKDKVLFDADFKSDNQRLVRIAVDYVEYCTLPNSYSVWEGILHDEIKKHFELKALKEKQKQQSEKVAMEKAEEEVKNQKMLHAKTFLDNVLKTL